MASTASTSTSTSTATQTDTQKSYKRLPLSIIELLDVAIFTFACVSGLRSTDKVRGDPVLKGVCVMFGRLLSCASPRVMDAFGGITSARLGDWKPGEEPTPELLTLVSSKMKAAKAKEILSDDNPSPPEALVERVQRLNSRTDRVETKIYPRCWRCKKRCRFCRLRSKSFLKHGFRTELVSPFLDVLDEISERRCHSDETDESDEEMEEMSGGSEISEEESKNLVDQCISGDAFPEEHEQECETDESVAD